MNWHRCTLKAEGDELTVVVDVILSGGVVVSGFRYYGEVRIPETNSLFPVIFIEENNVVDNGTAVDTDGRYEQLVLHGTRMAVGADFNYRWPDGSVFKLKVVSCTNVAEGREANRGGRPPRTDDWTYFWLTMIAMARAGELNRQEYPTQQAMIEALKNNFNVDLSEESLRPRVSQIWNKLGLGQS